MLRTPGPVLRDVSPPPLPLLDAPWSAAVARASGEDLARIHTWMSAPHVAARWDQAWSVERWRSELAGQLAGVHSRPCLVALDGDLLAYIEVYRAVRDRLAVHYPVRTYDIGLHVAIGDPAHCGRGLGTALLRAVADGLLAADPACDRVVAEPDETNAASVRAFGRAGFRAAGRVRFPQRPLHCSCGHAPTTTCRAGAGRRADGAGRARGSAAAVAAAGGVARTPSETTPADSPHRGG